MTKFCTVTGRGGAWFYRVSHVRHCILNTGPWLQFPQCEPLPLRKKNC